MASDFGQNCAAFDHISAGVGKHFGRSLDTLADSANLLADAQQSGANIDQCFRLTVTTWTNTSAERWHDAATFGPRLTKFGPVSVNSGDIGPTSD